MENVADPFRFDGSGSSRHGSRLPPACQAVNIRDVSLYPYSCLDPATMVRGVCGLGMET